jgi:hypothetical protein
MIKKTLLSGDIIISLFRSLLREAHYENYYGQDRLGRIDFGLRCRSSICIEANNQIRFLRREATEQT